jgi:hypothetical protein
VGCVLVFGEKRSKMKGFLEAEREAQIFQRIENQVLMENAKWFRVLNCCLSNERVGLLFSSSPPPRGRMTKKATIVRSLPSAEAAAQPCTGPPYFAPTGGLRMGDRDSFCEAKNFKFRRPEKWGGRSCELFAERPPR